MSDGFFGGIGDFFLNRGRYADPNAINAQYGVPEADVRQAGINTLANVSGLLLAAGQPMSGRDRAQLLAGIGPALGGMQTDIFKASQARLMTAQQRGAMEEARGLASLGEKLRTNPQEIADMLGQKVELVRTMTPSSVMELMKKRASVDPLERRAQELKVGELEAAEAAKPTVRAALEAHPFYGRPENAAARELILTNRSLQDDFLKSITQREKQFRPMTPEEKTAYGLKPEAAGYMTNEGPKVLGGSGVTVNLPSEAKGASEIDVNRIKDSQKAIRSISTIAAPLELAQRQLLDGGLETGVIQSATLGVRKLLSGLNILSEDQVKNLTSEELFNSVTNFIVPRMRVEGSGATSNYEDQLFQAAAPQLSKGTAGNLLITSYLKQNIDYEKAYARAMDKYYRDNKGSLSGFDDWAAANIPPAIPSITSGAQYKALKRGTMYFSPQRGTFLIKREDD